MIYTILKEIHASQANGEKIALFIITERGATAVRQILGASSDVLIFESVNGSKILLNVAKLISIDIDKIDGPAQHFETSPAQLLEIIKAI